MAAPVLSLIASASVTNPAFSNLVEYYPKRETSPKWDWARRFTERPALLQTTFGREGPESISFVRNVDKVFAGKRAPEVETLSNDVFWPNEAEVVPEGAIRNAGRYDVISAQGFFPRAPGTGDISVYSPNGDKTVLTRPKEGFFYHVTHFHDMNGDGRQDIVTARTKVPFTPVIPGNPDSGFRPDIANSETELLWLEQPLEGKLSSTPWTEHIINRGGAGVAFKLVDMDNDGSMQILTSEFFQGLKVAIVECNAPTWAECSGTDEAGDLVNESRLNVVVVNQASAGGPPALPPCDVVPAGTPCAGPPCDVVPAGTPCNAGDAPDGPPVDPVDSTCVDAAGGICEFLISSYGCDGVVTNPADGVESPVSLACAKSCDACAPVEPLPPCDVVPAGTPCNAGDAPDGPPALPPCDVVPAGTACAGPPCDVVPAGTPCNAGGDGGSGGPPSGGPPACSYPPNSAQPFCAGPPCWAVPAGVPCDPNVPQPRRFFNAELVDLDMDGRQDVLATSSPHVRNGEGKMWAFEQPATGNWRDGNWVAHVLSEGPQYAIDAQQNGSPGDAHAFYPCKKDSNRYRNKCNYDTDLPSILLTGDDAGFVSVFTPKFSVDGTFDWQYDENRFTSISNPEAHTMGSPSVRYNRRGFAEIAVPKYSDDEIEFWSYDPKAKKNADKRN